MKKLNLYLLEKFGDRPGYVGNSKSERAVYAEKMGLRNKSNMDNEFLKNLNFYIKKENPNFSPVTISFVKNILDDIIPDEWHHTSIVGNKTDYYSVENVGDYILKNGIENSKSNINKLKNKKALLKELQNVIKEKSEFISKFHLMKNGTINNEKLKELSASDFNEFERLNKKENEIQSEI